MIVEQEGIIRLAAFLSVLIFLAILESIIPRRKLSQPRSTRWTTNLSITFLNTLLLRALLPASAVGIAIYAKSSGVGFFNLFSIPPIVEVVVSVLLLDLLIYAQHVLFHHVPLLWRIHRMHHTDLDLDVTSGSRFHPLEIIISIAIKSSAILILGISPLATVIFELLLSLMSLATHSNIYLPLPLDKVLRTVLVTPDMHRVHHSTIPEETNSNYSFNLSIWDRLFRTYTHAPKRGQMRMQIGLKRMRNVKLCTGLIGLLKTPFLRK